jgi:glycosyltransferase involved in cell wall biosynthesis
VQFLVEALRCLAFESKINAKLIIVGNGLERCSLERTVNLAGLNDRVIFTGFVPHDQIPSYIMAADVFVLPSLSEGLPNALLEAMAGGLPIVATKVGGIPEVIDEGINGFLVDSRNAEQIANKLLLLESDSALRQLISKNNKDKIKAYDLNHVISRLDLLYRSIIKRTS